MTADRRISKKTKGQGNSTCEKPACLYGTESVRKQLDTKNNKSNEGRQEKNGGFKGRSRITEELDRETGRSTL